MCAQTPPRDVFIVAQSMRTGEGLEFGAHSIDTVGTHCTCNAQSNAFLNETKFTFQCLIAFIEQHRAKGLYYDVSEILDSARFI